MRSRRTIACNPLAQHMSLALVLIQDDYARGNKEMARYRLGGCATLLRLTQKLRILKKITTRDVDEVLERSERGRAIFEELDMGGAAGSTLGGSSSVRRYPDTGAAALDQYMAEAGM